MAWREKAASPAMLNCCPSPFMLLETARGLVTRDVHQRDVAEQGDVELLLPLRLVKSGR